MSEQVYKKSITWWVGFYITIPIRLVPLLILVFVSAFFPWCFYGIMRSEAEDDQSKWDLRHL